MLLSYRRRKLYKKYVFGIGCFCFLTLVLHLIYTPYDLETHYIFRVSIQRTTLFSNNSNTKSKSLNLVPSDYDVKRGVVSKGAIKNIWDVHAQDDRISAQLKFKPKIDETLPSKRILVQYGTSGWDLLNGNHIFMDEKCLIDKCELVSDPEDRETYDARMFKENDLHITSLPKLLEETPRHSDQVWIMFGLESPEASPNYIDLENVLNWTATYRPDSTIVTPYDKWMPFGEKSNTSQHVTQNNYSKGKTKLGAIFVSNCQSSNDRLEYIGELQKYISIDMYGECGDQKCGKKDQQSCFDMLKKDYKFYFAFENANCRHYITEKFFLNALRHDVLPVVMGAHPDDYKRVAPPGSYIHVEDFDSPKDLADYLKKLDADDDEYNKYFHWKNTGRFINTKFWCRICSMLWDPNKPRLSVPDLNQWWRGNNTCIGAKRWGDNISV